MADRTVIVRIALRAGQFQSGLAQASGAVRGFGVDVTREANNAARGVQGLGLASAAAGKLVILGIGGAMAVSAKAAIDFESSLAGVAKTTGLAGNAFDHANTPLKVFGDAIRGLSLRIPVDVNSLNRIAELGGQLGIAAPQLIKFTDVIARFASSTNLSIDEAATGMARFANIMGTSEGDFERVASVIVELGNKFAASESEILHFALRIAPIAVSLGTTEEGVLAISTALTSLGIPAERGGTAIQRLFISMAQAIDSGGQPLIDWAEASNISVTEFIETFERAPDEAFGKFVKGLNDINVAGGSVFGTLRNLGIIEQRSIQVLLAASAGWKVVEDAIKTANAEGAEANALAEESARRFGTTASQMQILGNAFNDLRIEIGGAILGTGGLAAAITVVTEFFGIMKDNVDTIKNVALALALLGGARLLMSVGGLLSKFQLARTEMRLMVAGASNLKIAMAGTNLALGVVGVGVGLLAAAWGFAAIQAAELKARVEALNAAIAEGIDPIEAYRDSLIEAGILDQERQDALARLGISQYDYVKALLAGEDAMGLINAAQDRMAGSGTQLSGVVDKDAEAVNDLFHFLNILSFGLIPATDDMDTFAEAVRDSEVDLERFTNVAVTRLMDALNESGKSAGMTAENMEFLARAAIDMFGIGVTNDQFLNWLNTASIEAVRLQNELQRLGGPAIAGPTMEFNWMDTLSDRGQAGIDAREKFYEDVEKGMEQFNEDLKKRYEDIRATIIGGMPSTGDYEQMATQTRDGLALINAAQDLYLQDLDSWIIARAAAEETASANTLAFIDSMSAQEKGSLGRMFTADKEGFLLWLEDMDLNFAAAEEKAITLYSISLPTAARAGFAQLLMALNENAGSLELSGEETVQAFMVGVSGQLAGMPAEMGDEYLTYMMELFGNEEQLLAMGFDIGDPIIQGIINALKTLSSRAKSTILYETGQIIELTRFGTGAKSPSKYTYEIGLDLGRGLLGGFADELKSWNPMSIRGQLQPKIDSLTQPMVNVMPAQSNKTVTVNLNRPNMGGNVAQDMQLAGLYASTIAGT